LAGQSLVSDLIISRIYNIIAVIYGATIKDDNGQVLEALVGIRDGTGLSSNFDTLGFGEGGWAFIFDQDGTVFALLYRHRDASDKTTRGDWACHVWFSRCGLDCQSKS